MQYLKVKIIPKSPKSERVETLADGTIKIRIKGIPEKGKANEELRRFLSTTYKIPREKITIISGARERTKLIRIDI